MFAVLGLSFVLLTLVFRSLVIPVKTIVMNPDRKMHFTGLRGWLWRMLGVDRSVENPNLCDL